MSKIFGWFKGKNTATFKFKNMEIGCTDANIFDQKADVLVCPSGPHLYFIQGLAKEISVRAGKRFQMRCDDEKG